MALNLSITKSTVFETKIGNGRFRPSKEIAEALGRSIVATLSTSGFITLYPQKEFAEWLTGLNDLLAPLSQFDPRRRELQLHFVSFAQPLEPDDQGRYVIPEALRKVGDLDDAENIVLVPLRDGAVEIWPDDKFRGHLRTMKSASYGESIIQLLKEVAPIAPPVSRDSQARAAPVAAGAGQ